jgi:hypothetical protein
VVLMKFLYARETTHLLFPHAFWPTDPHWWDSERLSIVVSTWCVQNIRETEGLGWIREQALFWIRKDEDAFAFRLRWC